MKTTKTYIFDRICSCEIRKPSGFAISGFFYKVGEFDYCLN